MEAWNKKGAASGDTPPARKVMTILFVVGCICMFSGALMRSAGWEESHLVKIVADGILFATFAIAPFLTGSSNKAARVINGMLSLGVMLMFGAALLKDFHLEGNKYLRIVGLVLALTTLIIYLFMYATGRMQTGKIATGYANLPVVQLTNEELDVFAGSTYFNAGIPLSISFTRTDNTLIAQASNQKPFPLEAIGDNTFRYDHAGIIIIFDTLADQLTLKQHGKDYVFLKEG